MLLGKPLLDTLERMGCGGVVLDGLGNALLANPTAERLLEQETGPPEPHRRNLEWVRGAIKTLLTTGGRRFRLDADHWAVVPREDRRPLVLHAVVIDGTAETDAHTVLILVDLDGSPLPSPAALQTMFGLTAAEAQLALAIARGETPAGVARTRGVALATVRSQLASVLGKTQTRRQAELVALLARVSILP